MRNWFETLNEALEAENLLETFPLGYNLAYGQTIRYAKDGLFVTIYRAEDGRYERPISYSTKCDNFAVIV